MEFPKTYRTNLGWAMSAGALIALIAGKSVIARSAIIGLVIVGSLGGTWAAWEHKWLRGWRKAVLVLFIVWGGMSVFGWWVWPGNESLPDLRWSFGTVGLSDITSDDGKLLYPTGTPIQVTGTITNAGSVPTIVANWKLNVRLVGESEFRPTNLVLFGNSTKMIMGKEPNAEQLSFKEGYLPDVTATNPIAPGAGKAGFVVFILQDMPRQRVRMLGTTVILSFQDVNQKPYSFDLTLTQRFTGPVSIPGIPRAQ